MVAQTLLFGDEASRAIWAKPRRKAGGTFADAFKRMGLLATPTLALTQAIKTAKGPRRLEVEFPSGRRSFGWVTISTR
jgi:hypothetical protein